MSATAPPTSPRNSDLWIKVALVGAGIVVLLPAVRMIATLLGGTALQHNDYWRMILNFTTESGGLDIGGLFTFQNEHPVVIPQLFYWLNIVAFSGSNFTLGVVVVAIVSGQVALVTMIGRWSGFGRADVVVLAVTASTLLFSLVSTWSFFKAMSGTAWLTAQFFAVAAVAARSRDRKGAAGGLAAAAAISYGTGIIVWPAVIACGVARRGIRESWREWPYAAAAVATLIWYLNSAEESIDSSGFDAGSFVPTFASLFGVALGLTGTAAELVGIVPALGVPLLALILVRGRAREAAAGFVGIATFGWVANLQLAFGRGAFTQFFGFQNRYASLALLTWIGFTGLVLLVARPMRDEARRSASSTRRSVARWVPVFLVAPLLLAGITAGREHADDLRSGNFKQDLRSIVLRLDLADANAFVLGGFERVDGELRGVTRRLTETDHYPFSGWGLDCGLLGSTLETAPGGGARTQIEEFGPGPVTGGAQFSGRLDPTDSVKCVVVVDQDDVVIGAAAVRGSGGATTGFTAVARRADRSSYRVVAIRDDGQAFRIGPVVTDEEIGEK